MERMYSGWKRPVLISLDRFPQLLLKGILILLLALAFTSLYATAASNTVPTTGLTEQTQAVSVNILKPPECSGLSLDSLVTGSGEIDGSGASELILGSSLSDDITAKGASDCLVAGDGNDILDSGTGADVLIGGTGNDSFYAGNADDVLYGGEGDDTLLGETGNDVLYGGEGNDTLIGGPGIDLCFGGNGTDTFSTCETIVDP